VDMTDADTVTQEVRSIAWMMTKRLDLHEMARDGRVFFFQWDGLHSLGRAGDVATTEVREAFRACLAWDHHSKGGRVQEIWNREAIDSYF
jgi:hypothetical protein